MNSLQRAMINADAPADVLALTAIEAELHRPEVHQIETPPALIESEGPSAQEVEAQRQRDLDAALADAVEIVARHRQRLGRRICSRNDGRIIRAVFEQLRVMSGPDALFNDPGFDGSLGT
jgi:hypothetical protein